MLSIKTSPLLADGDLSVSSALAMARAILRSARAEGLRTVAQAREQAGGISHSARAQGYAEGALEVSKQLISTANMELGLIRSARFRMVDIVSNTVREILQQDIAERPEGIVARVEHATEIFGEMPAGTLRINPADMTHFPRCERFSVIADASLSKGSFVIKTSVGEIRADIGGQIERLAEALMESVA